MTSSPDDDDAEVTVEHDPDVVTGPMPDQFAADEAAVDQVLEDVTGNIRISDFTGPEDPEQAAEAELADRPATVSAPAPTRELASHEVLVVDSDESVGRGFGDLLKPDGITVTWAATPERAIDLVGTKFFGVVIVDLDTPGPDKGLETIRRIRKDAPASGVIALVARRSFDASVSAFRAGARDVVPKSETEVEYLRARILDAAADVRAGNRNQALHRDVREFLDEFLRTFLASERRSQEFEDKLSGRDASLSDDRNGVRVLVIDSDSRVHDALVAQGLTGFSFVHCPSGGEGLDRSTSETFQLAVLGPVLPDLPVSMVLTTLRQQNPELLVITYEPRGPLVLAEPTRTITLVEKFTAVTQLSERLTELAEAYRGKARERRYLMAFRERHYSTLKTLQALRKRLEG